jgi:hypothetical protein
MMKLWMIVVFKQHLPVLLISNRHQVSDMVTKPEIQEMFWFYFFVLFSTIII